MARENTSIISIQEKKREASLKPRSSLQTFSMSSASLLANSASPPSYHSALFLLGPTSSLLLILMNTPLVPNPLLDSIHLVEQLGERFLWIDRLCVVQDDVETKLQEINSRDKIYGNAFLAIIAATGDNAEAGLQGVHTDRTDTIQVIEEFLLGLRRCKCSMGGRDSQDKI
jgi:Heterokaryon incompatibility protein (HET)